MGEESNVYRCINDIVIWVDINVLANLFENAKQKPSFSSSTLLLFGIFFEDIPQLIVTFLIEDKIGSNDPTGRISGTAVLNLIFAIFDILHKIASALDLISDVHNTSYKYKKWVKAHGSSIYSLVIAGSNQILSASLDQTVKLWSTATGKFKSVKISQCGSGVMGMVVATRSSKVMAACQDKKIHVFDFETGDLLESPIELGFKPDFISLSHNSKSMLTS